LVGTRLASAQALSGQLRVATRFWSALDAIVDAFLAAVLVGDLVVVLANVVTRTFFGFSILWMEEVSSFALTALAFIGGAVAYPRGQHIAVLSLVGRLPARWRAVQQAGVNWLVFGIAAYIAFQSIPLLISSWMDRSTVLQIRGTWFVMPLTVGMVLLGLYALRFSWTLPHRASLGAGIALVLVLGTISLTQDTWRPMVGESMLWISLVLFGVLVLLGLPIGFVLAVAAVSYLYGSGASPLVAIPIQMARGANQFVLLAIPFFILAGLIMAKGGVSSRMVAMIRVLVGHFRAGLLHVTILSMFLFSGISGSKAADMAAVGSALSGTLRDDGYEPSETAALLAASAAMGETIPPSIAMIVLGSISSVSVGALFVAGIVPAAVLAAGLMTLVYFRARYSGKSRTARASSSQMLAASARGLPTLIVPVILVGGILTGIATPTEVSSVAVAVGLLLAVVVYREAQFKQLVQVTRDTSGLVGMILFILSTATAFTWAVTVESLPQRIALLMAHLPGGQLLFLLVTIVALIVMGSLLEGLPALLIFTPLLLPAANQLGVNPLHYGIVLIIAMGIGAFSPPIGAALYIACAIAGASFEKTIVPMLPYLAILIAGLVAITFIPQLSLALPALFHISGR
jgi:tripartite ATP-independent transporter DctM subunit